MRETWPEESGADQIATSGAFESLDVEQFEKRRRSAAQKIPSDATANLEADDVPGEAKRGPTELDQRCSDSTFDCVGR